jgi:PadR family transcriptional regulator, regulatory protein PadR
VIEDPETNAPADLRPEDMYYTLVYMPPASLGNFELSVLLAVARLGDDAYGVRIRRDVNARLHRDYAVGAIYTTLQRLEEKGLVRSRLSEPLPVRGGRARREYTVTAAGSRALSHARRLATGMWSDLPLDVKPS